MSRGFEIVEAYKNKKINLPVRKTNHSAGYDIEAAEDITIKPYQPGIKPTLVPTGIKAYLNSDEFLLLANRSSGPKKGLILANGIGVIDADYYNNIENEGHIYFQFFNHTDKAITIKKGDAIGQVIFQKYLTIDNEKENNNKRTGGFGSTDKR